MNNDDLDKLFRDKLSESRSTQSKADWQVFSKKLSQSEGFHDINFDKILKSKISNYNVPFDNKHWDLLKQRLTKEENLKRKIFVSTIIESAAIVILLFLFQQYDHSANTKYVDTSINDFASEDKKSMSDLLETDLSSIYSHRSFEFQTSKKSTQNDEELIDIESQIIPEVSIISLPPKKELQLFSVESLAKDVNGLASKSISQDSTTSSAKIEKSDLTTNSGMVPQKNSSLANNASKEIVENATIVKKRSVVNIPTLKDLTFDIASVVLPSSIKYKETDASRYIIPVFGFGQGIIKSSYDKIYNLKAYTTYSSQLTTGAFYAYKKNGVEVLSGLRYTRKAYNPQKFSEVYYDNSNAPFRVSLEKINYDIVEIPLQFKTYLKQSPVVNFYAKVGTSLNLLLLSKYQVNEKELSYNTFSAKSIATTSDGEIISNNAKLSKKEFNPGLLQNGGVLSNNTFLTVTGELGLERRINMANHFVLGVEYAKYFMVEGIGPNNDKFNVINLNIGLKHKIH
jgi:hypothetical protein